MIDLQDTLGLGYGGKFSGVYVQNPYERRAGIDLLRFISCLAIALWHYQHFGFVGAELKNYVREEQPFYHLFSFFYEYGGQYRVQGFWQLSGFVFFLMLGPKLADGRLGTQRFWVDRFARLYPLHIAAFLLVSCLQWICMQQNGYFFVYENNTLLHAFLQLFLAANWPQHMGQSFNGPVWSLSVLIPAYALFYVLVRRFGISIVVTTLTAISCAIMNHLQPGFTIFLCGGLFFVGGIAAILLMRAEGGRWHSVLLAGCWAVLTMTVFAGQVFGVDQMMQHADKLILVVIPAILILVANWKNVPSTMARVFRWLGEISFGVFMLHFPLQLIIKLTYTALGWSLVVADYKLLALYLMLAVSVAAAARVGIEKPAAAWVRQRLLPERGTARAG